MLSDSVSFEDFVTCIFLVVVMSAGNDDKISDGHYNKILTDLLRPLVGLKKTGLNSGMFSLSR